MVCGGLLTLGLFLSVVISTEVPVHAVPVAGPDGGAGGGRSAAFIALAMIVMALVAVVTWDALSLDPRDTAILGPLPIERGVHRPRQAARRRRFSPAASRWRSAACRACSIRTLMVAKLPIGLIPGARTDRHSSGRHARGRPVRLCVGSACCGSCCARCSGALHPDFGGPAGGTHRGAGDELPAAAGDPESSRRPERREARLLPPVWFVGLHEALAGSWSPGCRAARCPSASPGRRIAPRRAIGRSRPAPAAGLARGHGPDESPWRSRSARFLEFPLAAPAPGRPSRGRYRGLASSPRVVTLTARAAAGDAGRLLLHLQCLFRSGPHRVVMAGCTAVSIALSTVFLAGAAVVAEPGLRRLPDYVFSTQTIALACCSPGSAT